MINFTYKVDNRTTISIDDVSVLFNKHQWQMFEEAIHQHLKSTLIHNLAGLREELESANATVTCSYNSTASEFQFQYSDMPDELLEKVKLAIAI